MTYNLKTVSESANKKIGKNVACTYRAGSLDHFGTCPNTCSLLPVKSINFGSAKIDNDYELIIVMIYNVILLFYSNFVLFVIKRDLNLKAIYHNSLFIPSQFTPS